MDYEIKMDILIHRAAILGRRSRHLIRLLLGDWATATDGGLGTVFQHMHELSDQAREQQGRAKQHGCREPRIRDFL